MLLILLPNIHKQHLQGGEICHLQRTIKKTLYLNICYLQSFEYMNRTLYYKKLVLLPKQIPIRTLRILAQKQKAVNVIPIHSIAPHKTFGDRSISTHDSNDLIAVKSSINRALPCRALLPKNRIINRAESFQGLCPRGAALWFSRRRRDKGASSFRYCTPQTSPHSKYSAAKGACRPPSLGPGGSLGRPDRSSQPPEPG